MWGSRRGSESTALTGDSGEILVLSRFDHLVCTVPTCPCCMCLSLSSVPALPKTICGCFHLMAWIACCWGYTLIAFATTCCFASSALYYLKENYWYKSYYYVVIWLFASFSKKPQTRRRRRRDNCPGARDMNVVVRARSYILNKYSCLFLVIWYWSSSRFYNIVNVNYIFSNLLTLFLILNQEENLIYLRLYQP